METKFIYLVVNLLVVNIWLVIPFIMLLIEGFCMLIDRNEKSFNYPTATSLFWIKWCVVIKSERDQFGRCRDTDEKEFCGGTWFGYALASFAGSNLLTFLLTGIPLITAWAAGIISTIAVIVWVCRKILDKKKRPEKVFRRLKGE